MRTSTKAITAVLVAGLPLVACGHDPTVSRELSGQESLGPNTTMETEDVVSSIVAPPIDVAEQRQPPTTDNPLLGTEPDAKEFTHSLHLYSSSDPVYPRSIANIFDLYDVVAVGTIDGVVEGRQEFLGTDEQTGDPIVARYVNIQVTPSEFIQGKATTAETPLALERPWPTNLSIDELVRTVPVGQRVLVLGNYQDMEYVHKTSGPLIESGAVDASSVAPNLMTFPGFGLIIEDGTSAVTIEGGNIFDFAAAEFGIEIKGFDGAIDVLRKGKAER